MTHVLLLEQWIEPYLGFQFGRGITFISMHYNQNTADYKIHSAEQGERGQKE